MADIAVCKNCKARIAIHNLSGVFGDRCPKCGGNVIICTEPKRRQMTGREKYAAACLVGCKMQVGSYNKRFARDIYSISMGDSLVTEAQAANLWRMVYRYRRQIIDKVLVGEAETKSK